MRITLRHRQQHLTVNLQPEAGAFRADVDGAEHHVEAAYLDDHTLLLRIDGQPHRVHLARNGRERFVGIRGEVYNFSLEAGAALHHVEAAALPEIVAPMPGKVLQVLVKPGDRVEAGGGLLVLEAMKMENRLLAEAAGRVVEVRVAEGDMVDGGKVLMILEYDVAGA